MCLSVEIGLFRFLPISVLPRSILELINCLKCKIILTGGIKFTSDTLERIIELTSA